MNIIQSIMFHYVRRQRLLWYKMLTRRIKAREKNIFYFINIVFTNTSWNCITLIFSNYYQIIIECLLDHYWTSIERQLDHYQTTIEYLLHVYRITFEPYRTSIEHLSDHYWTSIRCYQTSIKLLLNIYQMLIVPLYNHYLFIDS